MNLKTKCHDCQWADNCQIKNSLNEIVQQVIKRTEESVRQEISNGIEYILITDVALIPTDCHKFASSERVSSVREQPLLVRNSLVTA